MAKKETIKDMRLEQLVSHIGQFCVQHQLDKKFDEFGEKRGLTSQQFIDEMVILTKELSSRFHAPNDREN